MEQIHHLSQVVKVVGDHDRRLDLLERKFRALAEDPQGLKRETEAALREESTEETPEEPKTPAKKTTPATKK